ncbi:hypothetical protein [Streptacidiphilus sp. P02-A3a]|uniref:hypothetical protein n=1 Tax=Streptacidiphilus sp. P02-A3a TaxID=2704468 RepID=UPI0015FD85C2|nr:hypothetical protein [Streptacidiphilus sp. P02-A3a]QMU68444.1 hypothetical protein GXP74_09595 [Streptacidiphilus sp. P02-A3a]
MTTDTALTTDTVPTATADPAASPAAVRLLGYLHKPLEVTVDQLLRLPARRARISRRRHRGGGVRFGSEVE